MVVDVNTNSNTSLPFVRGVLSMAALTAHTTVTALTVLYIPM